MKKSLSILLSVLLLLSIPLSVTAATEGYYTYGIESDEAIVWKVDTSISGDIIIPSTLGGYPVTKLDEDAFQYCKNITSVTFPDTISSLREACFYGCESLKSITIPCMFGNYAFAFCTGLENVVLPEDLYGINNYAFRGCSSLTGITLPDSLTSIGEGAFSLCSELKSMTIPGKVTTIRDITFEKCSKLTSIVIPQSVTSIGTSAFADCSNLTDVYYSGSKEQWESIQISSYGNNCLADATIHYNYNPNHSHNFYSEVIVPSTHTTEGLMMFTCECGTSYKEPIAKLEGHTYSSVITTPSTHTKEGILTYTCACGDSYTETIEKLAGHTYEGVVKEPTCTAKGYTTYTCECGDSYVSDYVDTAEHKDTNGDEFCDHCDEFLGVEEDENSCSHICHKSGFMGFIWKIINFFSKLFGTNPVCECGAVHY